MLVLQNLPENEWGNNLNLHLSIEISDRDLKLLLLENSTDEIVALEEFLIANNSISNIVSQSLIYLKSNPKTVSCTFCSSIFTLIPSAIYDEKSKEDYLGFNENISEKIILKSDKLLKHSIYTCYGIKRKSEEEITRMYPNVVIKPLENILMDSFGNELGINFVSEKKMNIVYLQANNVVYFNNFTFENKDEMMYFISLVSEKLGLDLKNETIFLSGEIKKEDEKHQFLKNFITSKNIVFQKTNESINHKYYTLFNQNKCV